MSLCYTAAQSGGLGSRGRKWGSDVWSRKVITFVLVTGQGKSMQQPGR